MFDRPDTLTVMKVKSRSLLHTMFWECRSLKAVWNRETGQCSWPNFAFVVTYTLSVDVHGGAGGGRDVIQNFTHVSSDVHHSLLVHQNERVLLQSGGKENGEIRFTGRNIQQLVFATSVTLLSVKYIYQKLPVLWPF